MFKFEFKCLPVNWVMAILALVASTCSLSVSADERILAYDSDIVIRPDAQLEITETIKVRAEGAAIRRGIYRDFPLRYRDRFGNHYVVDFEVLGVTRNGAIETWHTEGRSNGVRIYAGSSSRMLEPGVHEYVMRYRTHRQLGYFDDRDELFWNVTGTQWAFPIDRATATVHLPATVNAGDLATAIYTGPQGASGADANYSIVDTRTIEFFTTSALARHEGLTIAVGWPKGLVHEPGTMEKTEFFFRDNAGALALLLGILAMLTWYLWAWNREGRDPAKGVVIPRFEPPKGLSAAACRYVLSMGMHKKAFTAAVVSLGVKGFLEIEEDDGDFALRRRQALKQGQPSAGELAVLRSLLPGLNDHIKLEHENHREFREALAGLKKNLSREYKGRLFNLNGWFALPAFIISVLSVIAGIVLQAGPAAWIVFVLVTVTSHATFIFLLRAPTPVGRTIMDEIQGFKMYLETAERERLDRMRSPELTPQVFETFLPYAFALGVENGWCSRFARQFPDMHTEQDGYNPAWYSGNLYGAAAMSHISSGLGSGLSTAIASASTPPGSSSGSGGGGFSGGGGGGGGGGGW